ncbi:hypothetical protein [Cupriavidus sp. WS]|uniref:hypothetical protein n=1 Tax=Cupriavidus sp. WS TaxID=1312922 RepID=UPI0003A35E1E|nr:hypothetical protein [Cupriavidus sp. WS]
MIDQLWQARRSNLDLGERLTHLVDPIHAMDRTVDVMFAAMMVCALDQIRFDETIFTVLLDAFSNLQNIDDRRFDEFVEILKNRPRELFDVLRVFTLERWRRPNQDWFIHAAFEIAATDKGWPVAETAIRRWLYCYNKDAVGQMNRYPKLNEDEDEKILQRRREEIQDVLLSFSSFERSLLSQMSEISGEIDALFSLALRLLAGRPIAGFANDFIALGIGFALDRGTWSAKRTFRQLTTFNRVDREAAKEAFLNAIEPLRSIGTSKTGQWTVVRMLYATGDEVAASEASIVAHKLHGDPYRRERLLPDEWRQSRVADPDAIRPIDIDAGLHDFDAIRPDSILQFMGHSREDVDLEKFLPVACRFAPEAAAGKIRQILTGLLTRTGLPLRQLILNGTEYAPLMTRDMAIQLIVRVTGTNMVETFSEREQDILPMFLFAYVAPKLTASEQIDCMVGSVFGADYLLDVIPSLKSQPTDAIIATLRGVLDMGNEEAAYGVLTAAFYGETPITLELESLLLRCLSAESPKLRALSFRLASHCNLRVLRDAHVRSDWSVHKVGTRTQECWFGSILLAEACAKEEIAIEEVFRRAGPETWFVAASCVGETMMKIISDNFLHRLRGAIMATRNIVPPAADFTVFDDGNFPFSVISVDEADREGGRFSRKRSIEDVFEIEGDFEEKNDRLREISKIFLDNLRDLDSNIFIEKISIDDLKIIVSAAPMSQSQLLEAMEKASGAEFTWLKNIAFIVANLASKDMPERAVSLFQQALGSRGFITYALGDDLTLEHEAIWSSVPSEAIGKFWRQRILKSGNDEVLAREVLAAERFGAGDFIENLVFELGSSASTLDQAFAISIAGFSIQSTKLIDVIEAHLSDKGITGDAARKAKEAHDAARWAEKWVHDMWAAESSDDFWCCLMISKTCMDARISAESIFLTEWNGYSSIFNRVRKSAIKERNKSRSKTFLGEEAPDEVFVNSF